MKQIQLKYIVEGFLNDDERTVFLNGVGNSYDAKEFKENPINIHKIGTKEALKRYNVISYV